jgi:phosphoglycerate dehydrogenase-like enzyme
MRSRVAIVNSSSFGRTFPEHLAALESFAEVSRVEIARGAGEKEVVSALSNFQGLILGVTPRLSKGVLEQLPSLKLLARHGIGVDSIDLDAARTCNILVTRIPGILEQTAVAEHTIALLLALMRKIPAAHLAARQGAWSSRADFVGCELKGKPVGVIGLGNTGSRIAAILKNGFGAEVTAADPYLWPEVAKSLDIPLVERATLFRSCEVIILCVNLSDETRQMIGSTQIDAMKEGALLINAARGELVDEAAVLAGLASGKLAGYATDVLSEEPPSPTHPFLSHPKVILTPHLGAYTKESLHAMGTTLVEQVRTVLAEGGEPIGLVR